MANSRSPKEAAIALITVAFGFLLAFLIFQAIYRVHLHPLAKYPGPKLNAISPIPSILSLLRGRLPLENKKLHDYYNSPVIRVSPNELSFNSAQAWEDIYGFKKGGKKNFIKDPIHVGSVDPLPGASTLTMSDDDNHARQRRALSHSFSSIALMEQESIINGYVSKLMDNLQRMASDDEQFNMVDWLNFTTFDIIGDLAFGEPFGCLRDGKFHSWVALIYETVKVGAFEQATRRFSPVGTWTQRMLLNLIPAHVRARRANHLKLSKEKVLKRLGEEKSSQHRDFIYYILNQQQKRGYELHQNEIILNGALFIVAGSETTANLLSGLIARLIWNPSKYDKLCKEIRSTYTSEAEINYENTTKLRYLNACLEEGLRIHPPVPTGLLRTSPKGGDYVDGNWVPEGTSVAVSSWAAAHNPANFIDCDLFVPERFLREGDDGYNAKYDGDIKKAMQPFSLGPRGCIGKNLSYMEMRLILTRLLWNFDIESMDGAWVWYPEGEMKEMKAFMTWQKPTIIAKVRKVQR